MISNEKDEKEKMVGTYKGNTVTFTIYQGIDNDAEEFGHLVQTFDDYGRITESIYSTNQGGTLDMSEYTYSDDWSYSKLSTKVNI